MDEGKDKAGRPQDEEDYKPSWPKRPDTGQLRAARPRLDPPVSRENAPNEAAVSPTKWTSHPTSHNMNGYAVDDKSATRVLPVVEGPSRFENGKQQARVPQHQPQQPRPSVQEPPPVATPEARRPTPPQQTQPRRANDWQYEREENPYGADGYGDHTLPYTPQQRAQAPAPQVYQKGRGKVDHSKSYLSVDVDGVKERRGVAWIFWLLGGVIGLALIAGIAFTLAWQGQYAGKIYAGVSVLGVEMGGKTPDEAKKLLIDKVKGFTTEPVVLTWEGKEWRPSMDDLGLKLSIDTTVSEAFTVGRSGGFFDTVTDQWNTAQAGYVVPLTVQLSEPTLKSYLESIADSEIDQPLFEGDVRLNGTTVEAKPGKEGRSLNVYGAIGAVREAVVTLEPGKKIALPVEIVQPTVSAAEVKEVEDLLTVRLSGPITATTVTKTFTLDREQLTNFTTIERNPDRTAKKHIELGWKDNELKILADKWTQDANSAARDARFSWNNGALAVKTESIDGFETDSAAVIKAIKENADTGDKRQFALPGKVLTATVSSKDLPALGITDLMGSGTSTFQGSSQERATNIRVAGELLNGTVVPPGGTFSFLKAMGGIDEAHGFVEGYVIAAERTQLGVGGGVCQVSTTMFRAAFWSGLDITERNQHSYRVGWYEANGEPVGFDAAVFDPGVDLKFVNDTPHYVLIEAVTVPGSITVNVYGTKLAGDVKLEGPAISDRLPAPADVYEVDSRLAPGTKKQVETAHAGLTTVINRRIVVPGQPDKVDTFHSTYKPWPNWYIVASPAQIPGGSSVAPRPTPNP
ncbi:MAG: VanW family protein [Chloroflexota bacterium]